MADPASSADAPDDANAKPELLNKGEPAAAAGEFVADEDGRCRRRPPPPPTPPTRAAASVGAPLPRPSWSRDARRPQAMTYLAGTGVPTVHVHAGNVLLERPSGDGAPPASAASPTS